MSKSKPTPGPWVVGDGRHGFPVASIGKDLFVYGNGYAQREGLGDIRANARLISAAPDLLEALERLYAMYVDMGRESYDLTEIRSILKSAIDKATGGKG